MHAFTFALVGCLSIVTSRELTKPRTGFGGLSHSILNFGKMEVNLYLNDKNHDKKNLDTPMLNYYESPKNQFEWVHPTKSHTNLRQGPVIEECPCNSLGNLRNRDVSQSPTDFLSKILMSNDIFSFKDPVSSNQCCTSHEQIQEEFFIEFSPKQNPSQINPQTIQQSPLLLNQQFQSKGFPYLPFFTDTFLPSKQVTQTKAKPKAIEIFFFSTKKPSIANVEQSNTKTIPIKSENNAEIQVVGDKNTTMLIDLIPPKSSVKKDLTQDKLDVGLNAEELTKTTVFTPNLNAL